MLLLGGITMCGGSNYNKHLQEGLEFQDFITEELYERGIVLLNFSSRKHSLKAENKLGLEIKYDKKFRDTNNLYIETGESVNANSDADYLSSGINNKNWLFLIGDYKDVYIFSTKHLRSMANNKKFRHVETPTSQGFLLPVKDAENWCILKINFEPVWEESE